MPAPGYVWLPGYWSWNGTRHAWTPGHPEPLPRPGARWEPPKWNRRGRVWIFAPGGWR